MAFVIVSAGHLTDARLRTVRALPLALAVAATAVVAMVACAAFGYHVARQATPTAAGRVTGLNQPEMRVLVNRVGALSGRLTQLEQEAASLAQRLDIHPTTVALTPVHRPDATGGPLLADGDIARLEVDVQRLEGTLTALSDAALERDLDSMAYPNRMPVAGRSVPVSSQYGTRHDPFTGRLARHSGLDIPAVHGTPILASGGGRVVFAGRKGAYGQAVVIDHGDGLASLYGHASKLLVRVGDVVLPQQKIALVGSTGRSTGPHLHFEVIRNGQRVEPRTYLASVLEQRASAGAP